MPKQNSAVPVPYEHSTAVDTQQIMIAARGDLSRFGEVYARYSDRIYGYCLRRLGSVPDAEDLTSQVFERAIAGLDGYRGGSVAAWLFRIARNAVIDHVRRRKTVVPLESVTPDLVSDDPSPIDRLMHEETRQTLQSLVGDLPDDQLDLLVMRFVGGLSADEIGQVFDKSAGAVRVELHRIVKKLRVRYAQYESEKTE